MATTYRLTGWKNRDQKIQFCGPTRAGIEAVLDEEIKTARAKNVHFQWQIYKDSFWGSSELSSGRFIAFEPDALECLWSISMVIARAQDVELRTPEEVIEEIVKLVGPFTGLKRKY